ncbi:MAG: Uma2 family endonuclease [Cyanobacteria bacterium]|nr:Uma2 family endonuclease [Cyanobacteriota bacterium]MDW8200911.1 Uma2 family endonuclease [Cyanobacteriota bacterium SKYGB_h_bin112]
MTPTIANLQNSNSTPTPSDKPNFAETGWHEEWIEHPDGTQEIIWTPLTDAEFLHPREGDHLPIDTFHDRIVSTLKDLLKRWFQHQPNTCVYGDLSFQWDIDLGNHCPDVAVVFNVKEPERDRSSFDVAEEGVRPAVIMEVVSPRYRHVDRETKVQHYAQAQVQEYIIFDRRKCRQQTWEEVLGYRLVAPSVYQPITPDENGRILSRVLGLWISLQDGQVVLENAQTGERLLTASELAQWAEMEHQRAEAERQRADRLAALLRSQGLDPDQI